MLFRSRRKPPEQPSTTTPELLCLSIASIVPAPRSISMAKIQVRTFEQDARVHAGDNVDLILVNEPMPKHLYGENIGRLRTRHGGIFWMFATPLAEGSWIKDKIADDQRHCFTSASLCDNCSDWHPDPEMWTGKQVGVGKVLTRGTRPKSVFDAEIS